MGPQGNRTHFVPGPQGGGKWGPTGNKHLSFDPLFLPVRKAVESVCKACGAIVALCSKVA